MKRKEFINYPERKRIGERISEMRKEIGISQVGLSEMTGIRAAHIGAIELGKYAVTIDTLSRVAEAFDKKIDFVKK